MPSASAEIDLLDIEFVRLTTLPNMLTELVKASQRERFRFLGRLVREWERGETRFDSPDEVLLGVYQGSRLSGIGGITLDPYSADAKEGRVRRVYVRPELRGQGLGRRLVQELEQRAMPHFDKLTLFTDAQAGSSFYEALGYKVVTGQVKRTHEKCLGKR